MQVAFQRSTRVYAAAIDARSRGRGQGATGAWSATSFGGLWQVACHRPACSSLHIELSLAALATHALEARERFLAALLFATFFDIGKGALTAVGEGICGARGNLSARTGNVGGVVPARYHACKVDSVGDWML